MLRLAISACILAFPSASKAQSTTGDCSPIIQGSSNVTISCGATETNFSISFRDAIDELQDIINENSGTMHYHDSESIFVDGCHLIYNRYHWVTEGNPSFRTEVLNLAEIDPLSVYPVVEDGMWPFMYVTTRANPGVSVFENGSLSERSDIMFFEFQDLNQAHAAVSSIRTLSGECLGRTL